MAETMMAYPKLRHPFDTTPIHATGCTTVLYQGESITLSTTGASNGLLIEPDDLTRITGFELKPEGACFQDMCIPLTNDLLVKQDGKDWFDLIAFADLLEQPYVVDEQTGVWSFAEIPAKRSHMMMNAMAPDIEVTDRHGKVIRLADLKGKKALIVTWSSW